MKKLLSAILLTLLLTSMLTIAFSIQPTVAYTGAYEVSHDSSARRNDDGGNPLDPTDPQARYSSNASDWNASANENSKPYSVGEDRWDFNKTNEWADFAKVDGDSAELIIGINNRKPGSYTDILSLIDESGGQLVNKVTIEGETKAVVADIPLAAISSFVTGARTAGLSSYIEPNMKVQTQLVPNDPSWDTQWGPQKIEADWAWNTTVGTHDVLVAVVDTGVYYYHEDLTANYVALGYDWVNMDSDPLDDHGHGTHCAGIIAATLNNSIGIAGVAQVQIMAEKVLNSGGGGYEDWVANGIIHATESGASIISMSLGGYGDSELVHEAVRYAYDAGVLVIAAAGNENTYMKLYPAGYNEVIAVAATDQYDYKASFSNWGDWIELAAPGVDIYSTVPWGYESWSGTSMATPHVSGVAALVWSLHPNKTRDWIRLWLRYTADDLGILGVDMYYGNGRINARKTVEQTPPAHELIAYEFRTPPYIKPETAGLVNATVLNFGESNETDVTVHLLANGIIVSSTSIDFLASGNSTTASLTWSPTVEGSYNVTLWVVPVPGETSIENNVVRTYVYVGFPVKAVVLHSAGNVYSEIITNWQALNSEWRLFGDTMVYIDYATLNKDGITYDDIAATDADVLIISCAADPYAGWEFTDLEIEAITRYVYEGHGLIVTAGTLYYGVPNNNKLAPLLGLNETITWYATGTDLLHVTNTTHPLFANVPNPLVFPDVGTVLPSDGRWDANELVDGEYIAAGHYHESAIVVRRGLVFISPWLEIVPAYYHHHLQLLYNAITWSRYHIPEHELTVSLEAPTHLQPGESALLNATVYNMGLNNETDVELQLLVDGTVVDSVLIPELSVGTSYTLNYLWTPTVESTYNVTAHTPMVADEEYTWNNVASASVRVGYVIARVAVLNSLDIPSYFAGGWSNDYQTLVNALNAQGFYSQAVTNEEIISGILSFFDVFAMIDNVPNDAAVPYVVDFWSQGGGVVAFDSSICFLCYAGILPSESTGSNGIYVYWDYDTSSQAKISAEHPVTAGYEVGQIIYGTSGDAEYRVEALAGTSAYPYYTMLAEDLTRPSRAYVSAYEPPTAGKTVHVWDQFHWSNPDLRLMILNAMEWATTRRYEHDLAVRLVAPPLVGVGSLVRLNATVYNRGLNNETNVALQLLINGTFTDSVLIPELLIGSSHTLSYSWTPTVEATHNVTAYAPPVLGEEFAANNVAAKLVKARTVKGYVLFDQTHSTDNIAWYSIWVANLTERGYVVETHVAGPITSTVLEGYDVFIIPQAHYDYTSDELTAVQDFVLNGGGLLVIGDDNPWIYTSLTGFAGITWTPGGYGGGHTDDITPHPVTENVITAYFGAPASYMSVTFPATDIIRDQYAYNMLSVSEIASGKVLGIADEDSIADWSIGYGDNLRLANNVIDWLTAIRYEHDLAVTLDAPSFLELGSSVLLSATVYNRGLNNETNAELLLLINGTVVDSVLIPELLVGTSHTLSYLWTPTWTGNYNVTAYSPPLPGEEYTANNFVTKKLNVFFYARLYLPHEWVGAGGPMGWHADDASWAYTLPFDFPFYGVNYSTVYISSNGLITFLGPDSSYWSDIPELARKLAIAPAWDDWVTYDPYDVYIWQNSTHVGIRWFARHISGSAVANFEAILRIDGVIQFNYDYNDGPVSATLGISNGAGHILAEDVTTLDYINTIVFTPWPIGTRDVAVINSASSKTVVCQGYCLTINVTVVNLGDVTEIVNITVYANTTAIQTIEVTLSSGNSTTITCTWNTTGFGCGDYTVWAYAEPVPGETSTADNTFIDGTITVTILGDVDGDRDVDIFDIVCIAGVYGISVPDPRYDPNCDIDGDGDIDIFDAVKAGVNYGESW